MPKRALSLAVLGIAAVALAGCYTAPVIPPLGGIYSNYNAPLTADFNGQDAQPGKTGSASAVSILGLFAYGDCSVRTAAQQGGLYSVSYCDYHYKNVLGIYQEFTVIAHGK
jgi:hypothetical protein